MGMDPEDILYMDQILSPYSYHSNQMLQKKGIKTINVQALTADTKQVTLEATVMASGKLLKPKMIFKGKANR